MRDGLAVGAHDLGVLVAARAALRVEDQRDAGHGVVGAAVEGADGGGVAAELVVAALLCEEAPVCDLRREHVGVHAARLSELLERVCLGVLLARQHGERVDDPHARQLVHARLVPEEPGLLGVVDRAELAGDLGAAVAVLADLVVITRAVGADENGGAAHGDGARGQGARAVTRVEHERVGAGLVALHVPQVGAHLERHADAVSPVVGGTDAGGLGHAREVAQHLRVELVASARQDHAVARRDADLGALVLDDDAHDGARLGLLHQVAGRRREPHVDGVGTLSNEALDVCPQRPVTTRVRDRVGVEVLRAGELGVLGHEGREHGVRGVADPGVEALHAEEVAAVVGDVHHLLSKELDHLGVHLEGAVEGGEVGHGAVHVVPRGEQLLGVLGVAALPALGRGVDEQYLRAGVGRMARRRAARQAVPDHDDVVFGVPRLVARRIGAGGRGKRRRSRERPRTRSRGRHERAATHRGLDSLVMHGIPPRCRAARPLAHRFAGSVHLTTVVRSNGERTGRRGRVRIQTASLGRSSGPASERRSWTFDFRHARKRIERRYAPFTISSRLIASPG